MTVNRYRNLLPLVIHTEDGAYAQGEVFEKEFDSVDDERVNVESGLIAIEPRRYRVIGESYVHGCEPGGTFAASLLQGNEDQLVAGGHIERLDPEPEPESESEPVPKSPTKKAAAKRSAAKSKE